MLGYRHGNGGWVKEEEEDEARGDVDADKHGCKDKRTRVKR